MITCPDKRTKNWKQLVKAVGEPTAYAVWNAKEGLVEGYLSSLSQPTTQKETIPYKPKAVVEYLSGFNKDTKSTPANSASSTRKNNVSFIRLERDSKDATEGIIYFDTDTKYGITTALNSTDFTVKPVAEEVGGYVKEAKGIKTLKPGKVKLEGGQWVVVEPMQIEYTKESHSEEFSKPDTTKTTIQPQAGQSSNIEARKQEIQEKIDALKKQLPTPKLVMPQQISGRIGGIFNELRALEKASSRARARKEEALYKKYGTEAVDKARALESKFQNIVGQLIEKKLNFFYNEETQEHVKRCF